MTNRDDEEALWAAQLDMYAGYEAGDSARTDAHIHPDAKLWDSSRWELTEGIEGLNAIRAARPNDPAGPRPYTLDATAQAIDVWGDVAVVRHNLTVTAHDDGRTEHIRNTGVWRRFDEGWRLVHNHEERRPD